MVSTSKRLSSLDAFRGFTIALMILVNTPGSWAHVYAPLRHAKWHGCTPSDLIFPFFLFIVGVAMRFSFEKFETCRTAMARKTILGRAVTIFIIGLLLNAYPFIRQDWDWSSLRIMGVLQRIGLAYGIAGFMILKADIRHIIANVLALLMGYWLLLWIWGWYTGVDPYGLETSLVRRIDILLLGETHLWGGTGIRFDPEGLMSTFPAVGTILIGFLVGTMIRTATDLSDNAKRMAVLGAILVIFGWLWGWVFPINKQLWTSSYVLYTGGIATLLLSLFYWVIDARGWKRWSFPLVIFGTNSLFVFAGSGAWVKTIISTKFTLDGTSVSGYSYLYKTLFQPWAGDLNGSLLFALFHVFMWWLVLAWLYRKKIFIKI